MLNKHILSITFLYSSLLVVASFVQLSGLKEINYSNTDKVFHFIAYGALAWFWFKSFYHKFNYTFNKALIYSAVLSILFGIIIEVLQGVFTETRVTESNDILANTLGVCLTVVFLFMSRRVEVKKE